MNHNVSYLLTTAFQNFPLATIKVHQVANGWVAVMQDKMNGELYSIEINHMKPQVVSVEITPPEYDPNPSLGETKYKNRITEYL